MYSKKQLKKIFSNSKKTVFKLSSYLFFFSILIVALLYLGEGRFYDVFHSKIRENHVSDWNDIIIILLTLIIVCAGWMQFKNLNETSKGDFLLRIDERFGSPEILKARIIIHEFYCLTNKEDIDLNIHILRISEMILGTKNKIESSEKFIYLYNFLNFLETIAYFTNNNFISLEDINELLGGSLKYYYLTFQLLIEDRRTKYRSEYYYCELQTLAEKIHELSPSQSPHINQKS